MAAKFKVDETFRLKKDEAFTRTFPIGGYAADGSVGEKDKDQRRAGSAAKIYEVHDTPNSQAPAWYNLDFGDLKINVSEAELIKLFDPV